MLTWYLSAIQFGLAFPALVLKMQHQLNIVTIDVVIVEKNKIKDDKFSQHSKLFKGR